MVASARKARAMYQNISSTLWKLDESTEAKALGRKSRAGDRKRVMYLDLEGKMANLHTNKDLLF